MIGREKERETSIIVIDYIRKVVKMFCIPFTIENHFMNDYVERIMHRYDYYASV